VITRIFATILLVANLTFRVNVIGRSLYEKIILFYLLNDIANCIEPSKFITKKGPREAGQGSSKYWLFIYCTAFNVV